MEIIIDDVIIKCKKQGNDIIISSQELYEKFYLETKTDIVLDKIHKIKTYIQLTDEFQDIIIKNTLKDSIFFIANFVAQKYYDMFKKHASYLYFKVNYYTGGDIYINLGRYTIKYYINKKFKIAYEEKSITKILDIDKYEKERAEDISHIKNIINELQEMHHKYINDENIESLKYLMLLIN